jgi:glycosyltransferase involved in cell wall biosynthesis
MKISILLPNLHCGGTERVALVLATAFADLGHTIEFCLMAAEGEYLEEAGKSFNIIGLNAAKIRNTPLALIRYLRQKNPDLMIANMWPLTVAATIAVNLSRGGTKLLLVEHCSLVIQYAKSGWLHNLLMRLSIKATYSTSVFIAGVSAGVSSEIASLAGVRKEEVAVLHNPIPQRPMPDSKLTKAAELKWGCSHGGRIITVGRLKDEKNHSMLLRSIALLPHRDVKLMIVGDGKNASALRLLASQLDISHRVIFVGFQSDPSPFYATADVFALTSDYEGFGNVIVEAMSFGLPIVSTDCPSGPAEILEHGRWGRLVPVGNVEAFAVAVEAALDSPVDRQALKSRAADFSPDIAVRKYLNFLGYS